MNNWFGLVIEKMVAGQKCFDAGWRMFGRFSGIINLVLLVFTLLSVKGVPNSFEMMGVVFVVTCGALLFLGYSYIHFGVLEREQKISYYENKLMLKLFSDVEQIKKKLELDG